MPSVCCSLSAEVWSVYKYMSCVLDPPMLCAGPAGFTCSPEVTRPLYPSASAVRAVPRAATVADLKAILITHQRSVWLSAFVDIASPFARPPFVSARHTPSVGNPIPSLI